MDAFLKQVASHYFGTGTMAHTCFVFPNRRSLVFFRKYLSDEVREKGGGRPMMVPPLLTINDFFYKACRMEVTDKLRLLLELYAVYQELNPSAESLDEFLFWGDMMLGDFDDLDKYLVDARRLLQNVSDFKAIQDSYDYLSEAQRGAIEQFLSHFRDGKSEIVTRFAQLWNLLLPLYQQYKTRLREKGMAYEGMVYRDIAGSLQDGTSVRDLLSGVFPEVEQYVFVGLNALNECERTLLRRMRDARLAQFIWDYVSPQIQDPANKASFFMRRNVEEFPQAFPLDAAGLKKPEITVISVPSSVGQAKLAPYILGQIAAQDGVADPMETAFVLPDEGLLLPLLNSVPPEWDSVNVTMGYPMSGSALFTLLQSLGQMQLKLRQQPDGWYFYHRQIQEVFTSGLFRELLTEEEAQVVDRVKRAARYYVAQADLQGGPLLDLLFQPVVTENEASARQNHRTEAYLADIVAFIGRSLAAKGDMLLELDFAKRCHTQLNILRDIDLDVSPATHIRMLERLLEGISVPFQGEPLKGLQVMGPLETRALDFSNLVILSANEGMFPRRSTRSSFIPPELRKGFGLPTYEYQDAVWAYYFYRMIQRPQRIWLLYDSRTEGLKSGEESRYIKQLEYHFQLPMKRLTAAAALYPIQPIGSIPKTEEAVRKIREGKLSASTLQDYLACPAKFYYRVVEGLRPEDEVAESLDAGMLGNVFHHVMQKLYDGKTLVSGADIAEMLRDKARLRTLIRTEILQEMRSLEVTGRNLVLEEILLDYVQGMLRHDASLLSKEGSPGFRIIGLEDPREINFEGFRIKGYVDRMDSYRPGEVRIVDYKTGKVEDADVDISDENAAAVVEKLFGPVNKGRPKIALQLFVYDLFAHADRQFQGQTLVNAIYSTTRLYTGQMPEVSESREFSRLVAERLKEVLSQMTDLSVPFHRTEEISTCEKCDFKTICGR